MAEVLNVQLRPARGKRNTRRLRAAGAIPAVLYGHGQETICLSVPASQIDAAVRHGSRLVMLAGAVNEQAFIRELQWDTWAVNVLHVDFTRISAHEKVQVEVTLELRGEAPGLKQGGVLKQLIHQAQVECEATAIPEKLHVNVNHLNLGEVITVADLDLPSAVSLLDHPEAVVVQCLEPVAAPEEEEVGAEEAEPELIGRKREEGEEEEKKSS